MLLSPKSIFTLPDMLEFVVSTAFKVKVDLLLFGCIMTTHLPAKAVCI